MQLCKKELGVAFELVGYKVNYFVEQSSSNKGKSAAEKSKRRCRGCSRNCDRKVWTECYKCLYHFGGTRSRRVCKHSWYYGFQITQRYRATYCHAVCSIVILFFIGIASNMGQLWCTRRQEWQYVHNLLGLNTYLIVNILIWLSYILISFHGQCKFNA